LYTLVASIGIKGALWKRSMASTKASNAQIRKTQITAFKGDVDGTKLWEGIAASVSVEGDILTSANWITYLTGEHQQRLVALGKAEHDDKGDAASADAWLLRFITKVHTRTLLPTPPLT
jgi:hypothetical protein